MSVVEPVDKPAEEHVDRHPSHHEIDAAMSEIKTAFGDALRLLGE